MADAIEELRKTRKQKAAEQRAKFHLDFPKSGKVPKVRDGGVLPEWAKELGWEVKDGRAVRP